MSTATSLKGDITSVGQSLLSDQIETNVWAFLSWGLLGIGNFSNVHIPSSGAYGGDKHRLRHVAEDSNHLAGQVWEAFRSDWVWESGVDYSTQPITVSGVYVNGNFTSIADTGIYSHTINYPLGRVVFNKPIPTTSKVTCEYSHRLFGCTTTDAPWWKQVQFDSLRPDDFQFLQEGSGTWSMLSQNRVQLPMIVVEAIPETSRIPLEIGSSAFRVKQTVLFHVLTETPYDRKQAHDIITYQADKQIILFDKDAMLANNAFPLTADGSLVPNAKMYPDLIKPSGQGGYGWKELSMLDFKSYSQPREVTAPLYYTTIRGGFQVDMA